MQLECGPMPNVMAAQPNISGTLCECSAIPFLVPRCKVWLMPAAGVQCSNAANIGECKTWTQSKFCSWQNSLGGKSPQKCIYSVPAQEIAKDRTKFCWPLVSVHRWSNEAKTQNPLKFAQVPQTPKRISAVNEPKFAISWGHVEEILLFNKFFPTVDTCLSCEDIARQSCAMVPRWRSFYNFLCPVFSERHVPHISDTHSKFALRPHHV